MVQLFVRNLSSRSVGYEFCSTSTVGDLKGCIEARERIPLSCQGLVYAGRQLRDDATLEACSISAGSTVHLVLRLVGGKGGFGALLRGQGRNGEVTTNFDACRDLSGRRLRHAEAEKKLKEWRAGAKDREATEEAAQREREEEKAAKREAHAQVDEQQVREEQKAAQKLVLEAVRSALTAAPEVAKAASKRKAYAGASATVAAQPAKRSKMMSALEACSEDNESSDDDDTQLVL